jgi:hypothetical protein
LYIKVTSVRDFGFIVNDDDGGKKVPKGAGQGVWRGNDMYNGFEAGLNRYDFMTFLLQDVTHPTGWR